MTAYAELQVTSNFSFLRGASRPEELVCEAAALGHAAGAIAENEQEVLIRSAVSQFEGYVKSEIE